jgi:hypothetical protein
MILLDVSNKQKENSKEKNKKDTNKETNTEGKMSYQVGSAQT